jgi:protein-S-isoprenylcysteine O-methyltransferase Ste14
MAYAIAAGVLVLLGVGFEVWSAVELGWRRALDLDDTPPDPALPALVLGGPFGRVRHPQSLGLLLILAGAALAWRSIGIYAIAGVAGALVIAMAVRHDRELAQRFGDTYLRYRRVVPLLLPRLR